MAADDRKFMQVMPESTGDRVAMFHSFDIEINSQQNESLVVAGKTLIGVTSTTQAKVVGYWDDPDNAGEAVIYTILDPGYEQKTFSAGETVNIDGQPVGVVVTAYCRYVPVSTLVSGDNPLYRQLIDSEGAAYVRHAEGSPQFDAFGKMQISQATIVSEHILQYGIHADAFTDTVVGTASIVHQPNHSGALLSVDAASGDQIERIQNAYNRYQAGKSQLVELTCACGDSGKANNVREWGYADADDGLLFRLDGTTLQVVQRSSVTGSVVETVIDQANWNGDKLDGSGPSAMNLDVTMDNIYWIDFQWLGGGRVRMGAIAPDGSRVVGHTFENANANALPYMRTGTLPMYWNNENTGATAGTSELKVWCGVVKTEGSFNPQYDKFSSTSPVTTISSTTTFTPIFSGRAAQTFNGLDNRIWGLPYHLELIAGAADPLEIQLVKNTSLTGAAFGAVGGNSMMEIDTAATASTGGEVVATYMAVSHTHEDLAEIFSELSEKITRKADITDAPDHYTIQARLMIAGSVDVRVAMNWKEIP